MTSDVKTAVVITTIQLPTACVHAWTGVAPLFVVGDKKTPTWYDTVPGRTFLPVGGQLSPLALALPYNHYCRKMLGYVEAAKSGVDVIIDTDDDNMPHYGWLIRLPPFDDKRYTSSYQIEYPGFWNVYPNFLDDKTHKIWPRGFPLDLLHDQTLWAMNHEPVRVGVWQGLADGEPDVDAIYRLTTSRRLVKFNPNTPPVILGEGTQCPFNSQNTAFRRELFPLLYLPSTVSFRYTDILRGLVAQPIMWQLGYRLGFTTATVTQVRNEHDLMADFEDEVTMYLQARAIPEMIDTSRVHEAATVSAKLTAAYQELAVEGVVQPEELTRLALWLDEIGI